MSSIIPAHANQIYAAESAMLTVVAEGSTSVCVVIQKDARLYIQKQLKPEFKDHANLRLAMRKEWEVGRSLKSPYFVKYHQLVDHDGVQSLLMDYVDGSTMTELLAGDMLWFSVRENLLKFIQQLLEGLKHLHQQQVVHLDLCPSNIMLTNINQDLRIIDLGYCYSPSHLSAIGTTQAYSAPELNDKALRIDARADIYSAGRIIIDIIDAAYPQSQKDVSDIKRIAQKCCYPNRDQRYSSADEAIKAFANSKPQQTKRKWIVWLSVVMVAVVVAMSAWLLARNGGAGGDGDKSAVDSGIVAEQALPAASAMGDTAIKVTESVKAAPQVELNADTVQSKVTTEHDASFTHRRHYPFPTISDPNYSLGGYVSPTTDKSSIPFTITMKNKLAICTYQVDVILPNEECTFVRQPGSALLKSAQYRLSKSAEGMVGYYYDENSKSYILTHSVGDVNDGFAGTSGKVLTLYFDGSSLSDGVHQIILHTGIMNHVVDSTTVDHYLSHQKEIPFMLSKGKVIPCR